MFHTFLRTGSTVERENLDTNESSRETFNPLFELNLAKWLITGLIINMSNSKIKSIQSVLWAWILWNEFIRDCPNTFKITLMTEKLYLDHLIWCIKEWNDCWAMQVWMRAMRSYNWMEKTPAHWHSPIWRRHSLRHLSHSLWTHCPWWTEDNTVSCPQDALMLSSNSTPTSSPRTRVSQVRTRRSMWTGMSWVKRNRAVVSWKMEESWWVV